MQPRARPWPANATSAAPTLSRARDRKLARAWGSWRHPSSRAPRLPDGALSLGLVGDRGEYPVGVTIARGHFHDVGMVEQLAIEHAVLVDHQAVVDVQPPAQHP